MEVDNLYKSVESKIKGILEHPLMLYLLPSNQEEVYGCQVYAELLTETQQ